MTELKEALLEIGQGLLGQSVGGSDGPLLTFLKLALDPILGAATPDGEALRTFDSKASRTKTLVAVESPLHV